MKKITYLIISIIFLSACAGYEPIYTSKLQFEIADYSLKADKKLGRKIYSKLNNLTKFNKNKSETESITIIIGVTKDKYATSKDSAGKILEYRITLSTNIIVKDYLTSNEMLNHNFSYSSSYKVQKQYTDTKRLENKSIEDLINKTYENLLIEMSQIILRK